MKKQLTAFAAFCIVCLFAAAAVYAQGKDGTMNITVTIGGTEYAAQLEDNAAARELFTLFPLSVEMKEWQPNKEYYAGLDKTINGKAPAAKAIAAGDIMLYSSRSLVIFYDSSANTAGYVKLGHIPDSKNLKAALDGAKGSVVFSAVQMGMSKEQQEVYASYEAICRAMITKDRAAMERYFDKDLTFTHMSGKKQTRTEYLDEIMDGTLNYYKITTKDYSIRVNGDTAYMRVTHTLDAKVYGAAGSWTMSGAATYKKRGGIWVRVNESVPQGVL